jgi:hypothetical protein
LDNQLSTGTALSIFIKPNIAVDNTGYKWKTAGTEGLLDFLRGMLKYRF